MKEIAHYTSRDGRPIEMEYDTDDPCYWCGLPVVAASMGGTACCPWCDMGTCRFDRAHRVDGEGIDPATGKMHFPKVHYQGHHSEKL